MVPRNLPRINYLLLQIIYGCSKIKFFCSSVWKCYGFQWLGDSILLKKNLRHFTHYGSKYDPIQYQPWRGCTNGDVCHRSYVGGELFEIQNYLLTGLQTLPLPSPRKPKRNHRNQTRWKIHEEMICSRFILYVWSKYYVILPQVTSWDLNAYLTKKTGAKKY